MNILITGGSGYVGICLCQSFLNAGHTVTIFDSFRSGFSHILSLLNNPKCQLIHKDICDIEINDIKKADVVYHLAAITDYHLCQKNPYLAHVVNVLGTQKIVDILSPNQLFIYASTTVFYGSTGKELNETDKIKTSSVYGKTKYQGEFIALSHKNSVILRFASIFGLSLKMRHDLMVHDFIYKALHERNLVLFAPDSIRTFIHIEDAIAAYHIPIENPDKVKGEIFNVGSNHLNYSKKELAEEIQKQIKFEIFTSPQKDADNRSYCINYDKITRLGFKKTKTLRDGIAELIRFYGIYTQLPIITI